MDLHAMTGCYIAIARDERCLGHKPKPRPRPRPRPSSYRKSTASALQTAVVSKFSLQHGGGVRGSADLTWPLIDPRVRGSMTRTDRMDGIGHLIITIKYNDNQ